MTRVTRVSCGSNPHRHGCFVSRAVSSLSIPGWGKNPETTYGVVSRALGGSPNLIALTRCERGHEQRPVAPVTIDPSAVVRWDDAHECAVVSID